MIIQLCSPNKVANHHACLPIWYGQEEVVTEKVCKELLNK